MSDFQAMHVIEALRSGVPSRAVGAYFSEARPAMLKKIANRLEETAGGSSGGMIIRGKYGEGKTHLLNTVFSMASDAGMAVSYVSLGKETPLNNLHQLYRKIIANTYLPGAAQPGFRQKLEEMTPGSGVAGELLDFAATGLETDKIYHLLKAFLHSQDDEERNLYLGDLEGDFISEAIIRKGYRRVMGKAANIERKFSKTKHAMDYYGFMSVFFRRIGLNGWAILFDEAELIGRMGKNARQKCYANLHRFLQPGNRLENVFALFAFSASYTEDVIDKKHEFDNAESFYADDSAAVKKVKAVLNAIIDAPELASLTREEILQTLASIQSFHGRAYGWHPQVPPETVYANTEAGGYLLRTKIRAAIEFFDQLYQYGEAGKVRITELGEESFEEDVPELPD